MLASSTTKQLVEVAPFAPVRGVFSYLVPPGLHGAVQVGCRVMVPFGRRELVGLVTALDPPAPAGSRPLKSLGQLLDEEPILPRALVDLLLWTADYYFAPPGEAIRAALPPALQAAGRRVVRLTAAGKAALAAQDAVLRRPDEDLSRKQRSLLEGCAGRARPRRAVVRRSGSAALEEAIARGWVEETVRRAPRRRHELRLSVTPLALEPAAAELTARAPRQQLLLEQLLRAGGPLRISDLPRELARGAPGIGRRLAQKGLVELEQVELRCSPFAADRPLPADPVHRLTDEQQAALEPLTAGVAAEQFASFLLHGVTSSGKTEVYLRLIAEALPRGRTALVLVPEIALTPQLAARFRARFGELVAVLHSGLTDAERFDQWRRIRSGAVKIVVGARSAVFAPLEQLGVVIVDEEHDGSFKQEEGVRYNGRDVALVRAQRADAVAVLGSATPSLESYRRAELGALQLLRLRCRATPRPLPEVRVIDLRRYATGPDGVLSAPLAAAIEETLAGGEQAIVFLNRRGFATFVICKACGHVFQCEQCSVSLTHHRSSEQLVCHYCGYAVDRPERCPECSAEAVALLGFGTERVERALQQRFPDARVARLDRDTAGRAGLQEVLDRVQRGEVDILVGTQMVTKGHDFPNVTLVGVLCADLGLHFPDFRAAERTFQLLTQVAGRAGRGERGGRVLVQSFTCDHHSVQAAAGHDYETFYQAELPARQALGYPPSSHLVAFHVDGVDAGDVATVAARIASWARSLVDREGGACLPVAVLGPAEAPIQRLKGKTRWMVLLKGRQRGPLRFVVDRILGGQPAPESRIRVSVDVDPQQML